MDFKETINGEEVVFNEIKTIFESYEQTGHLRLTRKIFFADGWCYFFSKDVFGNKRELPADRITLIKFQTVDEKHMQQILYGLLNRSLDDFAVSLSDDDEDRDDLSLPLNV